ncbi:hypothetical protein [Actinomyces sp. W5033]|uniref:hypothetical protein n=1 Tax=Actinomyces sp. W5033 TaxID=3446479 RepID=UPI003EDE7E1C
MLVGVGVDQDTVEEDGVEELLEVVWGCLVEAVAVLEEVEGLGQVLANQSSVGLVAVEAALDGG